MQKPKSKKRFGQVLVERGSIDQKLLDHALAEQKRRQARKEKARLGELLMETFNVNQAEIAAALAEAAGLEHTPCNWPGSTDEALELVPRPLAIKAVALPLRVINKCLFVVMAEPQNLVVLDELRFRTGMTIVPQFSFRKEILRAIDRAYAGSTHEFTIGGFRAAKKK